MSDLRTLFWAIACGLKRGFWGFDRHIAQCPNDRADRIERGETR